ncbi:MAG: elongation factor Ts [Actinomycetota bacterium]|nr:elongation factor Ts [Actinomycetota bacterium]
MAEYSAKDISALRKATGAGMMDCKNALDEAEGALERALDILRAKGLSKANKLSDREATEGAVDVIVDGNVGAIVELNCNTDFVAKGSDFTSVVTELTKLVASNGDTDVASLPYEGTTVGDALLQLAGKLGENVVLGRVVRFESDGLLDGYRHNQNDRGTIAVLVEITGVAPDDEKAREVAHEIALHISFAAPGYLTRDDVPADVLEREQAVIEEKSRNEGVPEAKLEGAVKGRLNAFYKDSVLLEQPSVKDPKVSVGKLVEQLGGDAKLSRFARVKVGED